MFLAHDLNHLMSRIISHVLCPIKHDLESLFVHLRLLVAPRAEKAPFRIETPFEYKAIIPVI